jgi:hypothetical protein
VALQQVVKALQEAQEQVLELAQEQARVLGLAAAQVEELARLEVMAQVLQERDQVLAQLALVEVEAQVEVLGPGPLVEL